MFDVILTGAETHQGIIVIHSLAKRGVRMFVVGDHPRSIGFYSKYVAGHARTPSPVSAKEAFVESLLTLAKKHDIPYIFPVTESSLIPLDEHRAEVEQVAKLIAPSSHTIRCGLDKKLTLEIAQKEGVPVPRTLYPHSVEEAEHHAEEWGYPVILKPRGRSSDSKIPGGFDFKVKYAHNRQQLRDFLATCPDGVYPMMQDYAYGGHMQFSSFVEHGREMHSCFQDEMTRMLPITGGVGARRLSCRVNPDIEEHSRRIYQVMNWEGAAQSQWKGPGRDGKYTFMEVSVRIIASVGSPVFCGVDVPWMHYQYFTGQAVERANSYIVNKPNRWFRGDAITVARYLLGDTPESADRLPPKVRVLGSWLVDFIRPGMKNDVESLRDPVPGLLEMALLAGDLARLVRKRMGETMPVLSRIKRALVKKQASMVSRSKA